MKNKILLGLLGLLGFSGCEPGSGSDAPMYGPPRLMYGTLNVGFVVKGAVTDADDKPLENIRVVLKLRDDETDETLAGAKKIRDTVYTGDKGKFKTRPRPDIPLPWALIVADIDGPENGGEFESEEKPFTVQRNYDNDEQVYVNEVNFKLTEKDGSDESE